MFYIYIIIFLSCEQHSRGHPPLLRLNLGHAVPPSLTRLLLLLALLTSLIALSLKQERRPALEEKWEVSLIKLSPQSTSQREGRRERTMKAIFLKRKRRTPDLWMPKRKNNTFNTVFNISIMINNNLTLNYMGIGVSL